MNTQPRGSYKDGSGQYENGDMSDYLFQYFFSKALQK